MRLLSSWLWIVLSAEVAIGASISGTYSGRYLCQQWRTLELQISESGNSSISGVFTFQLGAGIMGSYSLAGQYDVRSGRFHLEPQRRIDRRPVAYTMIGMEGTFDPASRRLTGRIASPNCTVFELEPGAASFQPPSISPASPPPERPASVPPERRRMVTNVTNFADNGFEYWDSSMSDPQGTVRESEPIDDVIDWLKKQNFSCMWTRHVSWDASGRKGVVDDQVSVRERFVIECDGDCRGVRYTPYVGAITFHFGLTQPVPVLEIKGVWFGGSKFRWDFTRSAGSGPPPDIYVHRWTSSGFNSGGSCRAPKANNK